MISPRYPLSVSRACPVWGVYAGSSRRSVLGVGTGTSPGTGSTGAAASCSNRGAAVMVCGLSRADLLLPAPVPSSPVQDALFFGGRDLRISTALQVRGGTRGTLAGGVSPVGNGLGLNLGIQAFFHIGGLILLCPPLKASWPELQSPGLLPCSRGCRCVGEQRLQELRDPEGTRGSW